MWHHRSALYKDLSYFNEKEAAGSLPNFTVNDIKIIYVNCVWRNEYGSDPRSYEHYLSSSENKAWKKFRLVWDLNPWSLRYRGSALPIELTSQLVGIAEAWVQIPYEPASHKLKCKTQMLSSAGWDCEDSFKWHCSTSQDQCASLIP